MKLKRNDLILIAVFTAAAIIFFAASRLFHHEKGAFVQITVNGVVYKTLPLGEDTIITIDGYNGGSNTLQIKDGCAFITDADCPDKLCRRQKKVSYKGGTLVCLPHRVIVSVLSGQEHDIDGIAS
ncbi:MAG TPA: NusG domain II-containing protein [Lachnospiraceae bacterium]|nr:NusG domain II-containing protein [Lachnospiraceae bacterium]